MARKQVGTPSSGTTDVATKGDITAALTQVVNAVFIGPNDPLPNPQGIPLVVIRDSA